MTCPYCSVSTAGEHEYNCPMKPENPSNREKEIAEERDRYIDALIFCSGSNDFQVGGKARAGWEKLCAPLIKNK